MHDATEYLTAEEVASFLKQSTESIIRKFDHRKGVIDLGKPEGRFKRRYRVLRISREALDRYLLEVSVC